MQNENAERFAALVETHAENGTLVNVVLHSPSCGNTVKIKGSIKAISGAPVLQAESYLTEGRVAQQNIKPGDAAEYITKTLGTFRRADLNTKCGSASYMMSSKGKSTLVNNIKSTAVCEKCVVPVTANDREKNHVLTGSERFLTELGISDKHGRVHDKKQSKFRQICRFSEYIIDAEKKLRKDGALYVCDLCCGKSYLSFAAYHVLTAICGREVRMSCVDLKLSVIEYCADIAKRVGMDGMEFLCMDINDFTPTCAPDLVISLHACDVATDIVIDFAVKHGTEMILSTPCCHHRMNNELDCPTLGFIAQYSILKQKLCTAATDALRLKKLEAEGYKTDATELIDPEDTPKNVMLRAVKRKNFKKDSSSAEKLMQEYRETYKFLYGKYPD